MNEGLIKNWNDTVSRSDIVYCLGDFSFGKKESTEKVFNKLNGQKHLIVGNHDSKHTVRLKWQTVSDLKLIKVDKQNVVLCHYAMRVWNKHNYGSWHLYGHSHGGLTESDNLSFDMSTDCWDYRPVHFEEVKAKMDFKKMYPKFFEVLNPDKDFDTLGFTKEFNKQFMKD